MVKVFNGIWEIHYSLTKRSPKFEFLPYLSLCYDPIIQTWEGGLIEEAFMKLSSHSKLKVRICYNFPHALHYNLLLKYQIGIKCENAVASDAYEF